MECKTSWATKAEGSNKNLQGLKVGAPEDKVEEDQTFPLIVRSRKVVSFNITTTGENTKERERQRDRERQRIYTHTCVSEMTVTSPQSLPFSSISYKVRRYKGKIGLQETKDKIEFQNSCK